MINDIIDMSEVESGKVRIIPQETDMVRLTDELRAIADAMSLQHDIELKVTYHPFRNRYAYTDAIHLKRCVAVLLSNAYKFSQHGDVVELEFLQSDVVEANIGTYKFIVRDQGIGISPEFLGKIFEPFTTEHSSEESSLYGSGLGLSVAKKFIESMGGTIEVESTMGVGSCFTITLPMHVKDAEAVSFEIAHTAMQGQHLLLVEDNPLNRELAVELLTEREFVVDEAEDGLQAVNAIKEKGPDYYSAVLMDINMPVMNGLDATKKIRELYPKSRLPIIAMSANAFPEDIEKSKAAGMDAHIPKPLKIEALLDAIIKTMSRTIGIDALTGVKNQNAYMDAESAMNLSIRQGLQAPFAIVMCDTNNLKETNDSHGHAAGDELLKRAAKLICDTFSHSPVFRTGGDEFVAILTGSDYENRHALVNLIRGVSESSAKTTQELILACGLSDWTPDDNRVSQVFRRADRNMYENKADLKKLYKIET